MNESILPRITRNMPRQQMLMFGALLLLLFLIPMDAMAAMPWEGPLDNFVESLRGPVARGLAIVAFVLAGLMLAFGETKGAFTLVLKVIFGVSLALMATQWVAVFTA